MGLNRQKDYTKKMWRSRKAISMSTLVALSSFQTTSGIHGGIVHSPQMHAEAIKQFNKFFMRPREISATDFKSKFDQLSDSGCTQLFRFSRQDLMRLAPIIAWHEGKKVTCMQ